MTITLASTAMVSAEQRLSENVQLLGTLLDRAILDVEGEAVSHRISVIREAAIRCHQDQHPQAPLDLEKLLSGLDLSKNDIFSQLNENIS